MPSLHLLILQFSLKAVNFFLDEFSFSVNVFISHQNNVTSFIHFACTDIHLVFLRACQLSLSVVINENPLSISQTCYFPVGSIRSSLFQAHKAQIIQIQREEFLLCTWYLIFFSVQIYCMKNTPERAKGNGDSGPDDSGKSSSIHISSSDCDLGLCLEEQMSCLRIKLGSRHSLEKCSGRMAHRVPHVEGTHPPRPALVGGAALKASAILGKVWGLTHHLFYPSPYIFSIVSCQS